MISQVLARLFIWRLRCLPMTKPFRARDKLPSEIFRLQSTIQHCRFCVFYCHQRALPVGIYELEAVFI